MKRSKNNVYVGNDNPYDCILTANYHTHTTRCHHATGTERQYIEKAIEAGIKILGFADHSPYFFTDGYYSTFRMRPRDLDGYVKTLQSLQQEYKKQIEILIGLETEYYPKHFGQYCDFIADYPLDYLILAQHFTQNEYDGKSAFAPHSDEETLEDYVNAVIEAISTDKFSYVAHPDVFNFTGDESIYKKHMTRLCQAAKKAELPLEVNLSGYYHGKIYPNQKFFAIAAQVGNTAIFGCDAHFPEEVANFEAFDGCASLIRRVGIKRTEQIKLSLK